MDIIGLRSYLLIGLILFVVGLYTAVSRKNIIGIFMGIELILNSAALNFAAFGSLSTRSANGAVFSVFIIVLAAAEAAVALALLLSVYRRFGDINADRLDNLRG